jgi:hypothetical protein
MNTSYFFTLTRSSHPVSPHRIDVTDVTLNGPVSTHQTNLRFGQDGQVEMTVVSPGLLRVPHRPERSVRKLTPLLIGSRTGASFLETIGKDLLDLGPDCGFVQDARRASTLLHPIFIQDFLACRCRMLTSCQHCCF